jgi:hypothetical protein
MAWKKLLTEDDDFGIGTAYANAASGKHFHTHHYCATMRGDAALKTDGAQFTVLSGGHINSPYANAMDYNGASIYQIEHEDVPEAAIIVFPQFPCRISGYDYSISLIDTNCTSLVVHTNLFNAVSNGQTTDIDRDVSVHTSNIVNPGAGTVRLTDYTLNTIVTAGQFVTVHIKGVTSSAKLSLNFNLNIYWRGDDEDNFNEILNPADPGTP